jgi:Dyp-type peroxidase family
MVDRFRHHAVAGSPCGLEFGLEATIANDLDIKASAADIQGNVVGFNKDHQRLLFAHFPDTEAGRAFLGAVLPEINHASSVVDFNGDFKRLRQSGQDSSSLEATWSNLALSASGLEVLQAPGLDTFPAAFREGMRTRAEVIGDVGASAPASWLAPFDGAQPVHALVIIAADDPADLDERTEKIRTLLQQTGVQEIGQQDGNVRPGDQRGHEHFGFKDGISQPGIKGWTHSSKGGDQIAAGEFVIGYPDQDGHISGQPVAAPAPSPGEPGYPGGETTTTALPPWSRDGSFVVYRRLRQDVQGLHQFLAQQSSGVGLSADQLGAKLFGRWASGAPLEHVAGVAAGVDPAAIDPSTGNPDVLADNHINDFDYQGRDADGHAVPRAAHIRKSYPRDQQPPGEDESERHRILRRGIPYGPEVAAGESPYGGGPVPDNQDRGLLFLCYQADIERGFEFIQSQWVNRSDFPQPADGVDPVIAQSSTSQLLSIPGHGNLTLANWVTTKGGDYFFAPSISALQFLSHP